MSDDRVFTKCAWRLIPFMVLLYVVSFIDRTNAGFAALTMNRDLGFSPAVFGFGAGLFFVGYALFQLPGNIVLERFGAKRWIFCILAVWGLLSAANAFVRTPIDFYAVRFLLGIAEAGFFPGMLLYLTFWFPRAYLARFTASFAVGIPLSFAIGGPLASLILGMDGVAGLRGWQWLFLIEGAPAVLLSFAVLKFLPDRPRDASWLTAGEKKTIDTRIAATGDSTGPDGAWRVLYDLRVLALGLANFSFQASAYGVTLWLPQIVQGMGFSNRTNGFVMALPFVAGTCAIIFGGRSSSIWRERIWHVALPWLLAASCFAVASVAQSNLPLLAALTFALIGLFGGEGTFFSLPASFLRGSDAAKGIAVFNALGSFGGFFGPSLIGVLRQGSGDYGSSLMAVALGFVISAVIVLVAGRAMAPRAIIPVVKAADA